MLNTNDNNLNPEAQCNVGKCHYYGYGTFQDLFVVLSWFLNRLPMIMLNPNNHIGRCFYYGEDFHKADYGQAIIWLNKAADNNNADTQYLLGICFEKGQGVKKNEKEANRLLELAAKNGNTEAKAKLKL